MNGPTRTRGGFTLVEVMLTLVIMAGIMVTITQILTSARQTRDMIHNVQESQLAGPAILDRLEQDLRALFTFGRDPRLTLRVRNRVQSGFDADSIDFVSSVDGLVPYRVNAGEDFRRADVNEVGYRLRIHPDSDDFLEIYRREDYGIDEEPFEGGHFSLLHDRVKGFDVLIWEEDGPEAEPIESWGTGDDETFGLPTRIEVELTVELAPRLVREQLIVDRRTITYRRVIRFPEILRRSLEVEPLAAIPLLEDPVVPGAGPAGGPEGGPEGGPDVDDPDGGDPGGGFGGGFGGGGGGGGGGLDLKEGDN